jgi:hypothetical protein
VATAQAKDIEGFMFQTHQTQFKSEQVDAPEEFPREMASIALSIADVHDRMKTGTDAQGREWQEPEKDPGAS